MLHVARWKCRTQKSRQKLPSGHHHTTLSGYRYIFATKAHNDNRRKTQQYNMSSRCSHNMLNFGPLTADICWRVWGPPCKFQQVSHLGILLHGTLVVCVSHTLWPSRWASAHILVCICMIGRAVSFSRQKIGKFAVQLWQKTTKFAENLC